MSKKISESDLKRILNQPGYHLADSVDTLAEAKLVAKKSVENSIHSRLEEKFAYLYRNLGGQGEWDRDYTFDKPDTRMEFDFAMPSIMVAVEVNGGQGRGNQSGHSNWNGLERDARKQNSAQLKGWLLYVLTTSMVNETYVSQIVEKINEKLAAVATE